MPRRDLLFGKGLAGSRYLVIDEREARSRSLVPLRRRREARAVPEKDAAKGLHPPEKRQMESLIPKNRTPFIQRISSAAGISMPFSRAILRTTCST